MMEGVPTPTARAIGPGEATWQRDHCSSASIMLAVPRQGVRGVGDLDDARRHMRVGSGQRAGEGTPGGAVLGPGRLRW